MPINASIPMSVQPIQAPNQLNMLAQVMAIKDAQQSAQMNGLKMQEYQRGIESENALNNAYKGALGADGSVDRNKLYQTLATGGYGSKVPALQKQFMEVDSKQADIGKTKAEAEAKAIETAHKRVDSWGQAMGFVRQNPTPENAVAAVQHLVTMGIIPMEQAQAAIASAGNTPQSIAQWANQGFQTALSAKDQLPQFQTRNTGGTTDTLSIDPVTGKVTVANSVQNTQSPDNAASVAATVRGQNMTDARARENAALTRQGLDLQREAQRVQVLDTPQGVMLVDKGTGQARPAMSNGQPLPGKPNAIAEKELLGFRQQNAVIDGALQAVDQTPSAFGMKRGLATMAGPISESVAGRFDSDSERQARSYVFNNVSKIINERAGAAQSAQELARLRSFLPAETDSSGQIKSKLQAFKKYLGDMEASTRGQPVAGGGPKKISSDADYNSLPSGAEFIAPDGSHRRKP